MHHPTAFHPDAIAGPHPLHHFLRFHPQFRILPNPSLFSAGHSRRRLPRHTGHPRPLRRRTRRLRHRLWPNQSPLRHRPTRQFLRSHRRHAPNRLQLPPQLSSLKARRSRRSTAQIFGNDPRLRRPLPNQLHRPHRPLRHSLVRRYRHPVQPNFQRLRPLLFRRRRHLRRSHSLAAVNSRRPYPADVRLLRTRRIHLRLAGDGILHRSRICRRLRRRQAFDPQHVPLLVVM